MNGSVKGALRGCKYILRRNAAIRAEAVSMNGSVKGALRGCNYKLRRNAAIRAGVVDMNSALCCVPGFSPRGSRCKRLFLPLIISIILLLLLPAPAQAADQGAASLALHYTDVSGIEDFLSELDKSLDDYVDGFSLTALWHSWLNGELNLDFKLLVQIFLRLFFQEVMASGALLGQLLGVSLLAVLLTTLKDSFEKSDISQIGHAVVYLLLAGVAVNSFRLVLSGAREAVNMMSDFVYAALPVLLPLLVSIGGVSTVALVQPALLFVLSLLMDMMRNFIFPLIYFSAVLRLIGQISPKFHIDKLAGLLKDIAMGVMSVSTAVFIAFLSLSGMAAASFDGLTIKAVKTASGAFIPVVGRTMADALDSVLSTALLLKNVIGLLGAVVILLICALPAVKILAQVLIYRLAAALLQPLGEEQLSGALSGLAGSMLLAFAALAVCGLFCFFAVALLVGAGNLTMMMR